MIGPNCGDGTQNQDETDVDCGGYNCMKCFNGRTCKIDEDCNSGFCSDNICARKHWIFSVLQQLMHLHLAPNYFADSLLHLLILFEKSLKKIANLINHFKDYSSFHKTLISSYCSLKHLLIATILSRKRLKLFMIVHQNSTISEQFIWHVGFCTFHHVILVLCRYSGLN